MRVLFLVAAVFLAGCKGCWCNEQYVTSSDNGECYRACAIAAAPAEYYSSRLDDCIRHACRYPTKTVCR